MMDDYPVIGYAISQGQKLVTPIERIWWSVRFCGEKGQNPELIQMFNEALKEMKRTMSTIKSSINTLKMALHRKTSG